MIGDSAFRLAADHGVTLLRRIGRGGMGEVYVARRRGAAGFEKPLVVKRVADRLASDPLFTRALIDEAKLMVRLEHPNIVQVYDLIEADGEFLMLLEYVDGCSLRKVIATGSRTNGLPLGLVLSVTDHLLRALEHAHELRGSGGQPSGIVHCDVSPENVLLSRSGQVKLTDFGIARVASQTTFTGQGDVRGKLRYVAPEQIDGGKLGPQTDVYATGLTLYEMLVLDTARKGADTVALVAEAARPDAHRLPPQKSDRLPPDVWDDLSAIVGRATEPSLARRYASAGAMSADVRALAARLGLSLDSDRAVLPHLRDLFDAGLLAIEEGEAIETPAETRASRRFSGPKLELELEPDAPTVLVVDDSDLVRDALSRALPRFGWRVATAENATRALEWLESNECAVVLADLNMPDLSGIELCSFLRSNPAHASLPVILLTSESDSRRAVAGLGVGADDYVRKGVSEAEIAARLRAVVRRTRV